MWPWTGRQITPVGVEIDGPAVRLAQVEFRNNRPPEVRLLSRALPGQEQLGDEPQRLTIAIGLLRRMLADGGFVGRRIVASLPDHLVHLRTLRLVSGRSISLDAAVRLEARTLFSFPPEQLQLHYIEAGRTRFGAESRDEVIVAASPRDELDRLLVGFDRAGLDVAGLDLAPCAAYRACRRSSSDEREIQALLELGPLASHVIIGKAGQVRFLKRIAVGSSHLSEAVSRRLGISREDAARIRRRLFLDDPQGPDRQAIRRAAVQSCRSLLETLAAEVSACLRYYGVSFRGRAIERLLISGQDATDPHLGAMLSAALAVPVQIANPLAGMDLSRTSTSGDVSEWSAALGLAIRSAIIPAASLRADTGPRSTPVIAPAIAQV